MDQQYIGIKFTEDDRELITAIEKNFPECAIIRSDELEGTEVFFVAVLPLAGFVLQLLDFILNHIVPSKTEEKTDKDSDNTVKRTIVSDGKEVKGTELAGMNKQQVKKTLSIKLNINFEVGVDYTDET